MSKVRVYELAKELGIESKQLLAHLRGMGEFVRSASSPLEPPVARKVRETFASGARPSTSMARPSQHGSRATRPQMTDEERFLAEVFGLQPEEIKWASHRRDPRMANSRPVDPWTAAWIDSAEKREWFSVGVTENDLPLVKQWRQCGMRPEDLLVTFPDGWTALRRLRTGEPSESVAHRVREARGA
jgi:hypothetical protein